MGMKETSENGQMYLAKAIRLRYARPTWVFDAIASGIATKEEDFQAGRGHYTTSCRRLLWMSVRSGQVAERPMWISPISVCHCATRVNRSQ